MDGSRFVSMCTRFVLIAGFSLLAMAASAKADKPDTYPPANWTVVDIGTLHPAAFPGRYAVVAGINDKGQVIGTSDVGDLGYYHGFLYTDGVMQGLGAIYRISSAIAVNNKGQVIVHSLSPMGSTTSYLVNVDNSGFPERTIATALNDKGQVVGYRFDVTAHAERAFLWENGTLVNLGTLGGSSSRATDINERGNVVGESQTAGGEQHAFLYTDGNLLDLGTLGGTSSSATKINDKGLAIGSSTTASGASHAFLYQHGVMVDLGTFGGTKSVAYDINNKGLVVGYATTSEGHRHAFLYQNGALRDLGTLGGMESIASDINDKGQIVGISQVASGEWHAFVYVGGTMIDLNALPKAQTAGWATTATTTPFVGERPPVYINDRGQIVGSGPVEGFLRTFLVTREPGSDESP